MKYINSILILVAVLVALVGGWFLILQATEKIDTTISNAADKIADNSTSTAFLSCYSFPFHNNNTHFSYCSKICLINIGNCENNRLK